MVLFAVTGVVNGVVGAVEGVTPHFWAIYSG